MKSEQVVKVVVNVTFTSTSPIEVQRYESVRTIEESKETVQISGVLLKEGISRNGNLYTVEEMQNIASQVEGLPLYYGTMTKIDPNTGRIRKGMHADLSENQVGKIVGVYFDALRRLVRFVAKVWNSKKFPHIVEEVKKGWGVSIGGIADKVKVVLDSSRRVLHKIVGMIVNHVQLLNPMTSLSGVEGAQVERVEVQESFQFETKKLDSKKIEAIIYALIKSGDIDV